MNTQHKHISIRGNKQIVTEHYAPVTNHTRAGKNGKNIMCPICGHVERVYNFAWSLAGIGYFVRECSSCKTLVCKYNYLVDQLDTWRTPR